MNRGVRVLRVGLDGTGRGQEVPMGKVAKRRFEEPDETRSFGHGKGLVVQLAGSTAALAEMEPGWRWSTDIKPMVGTDSCQAHHVGYALAGRLQVTTDEGEEIEIGPGD